MQNACAETFREVHAKCQYYGQLFKEGQAVLSTEGVGDRMNVCRTDRCERLVPCGKTSQCASERLVLFLVSLLVTVPVVRSPRAEDLPAQRDHSLLTTTILENMVYVVVPASDLDEAESRTGSAAEWTKRWAYQQKQAGGRVFWGTLSLVFGVVDACAVARERAGLEQALATHEQERSAAEQKAAAAINDGDRDREERIANELQLEIDALQLALGALPAAPDRHAIAYRLDMDDRSVEVFDANGWECRSKGVYQSLFAEGVKFVGRGGDTYFVNPSPLRHRRSCSPWTATYLILRATIGRAQTMDFFLSAKRLREQVLAYQLPGGDVQEEDFVFGSLSRAFFLCSARVWRLCASLIVDNTSRESGEALLRVICGCRTYGEVREILQQCLKPVAPFLPQAFLELVGIPIGGCIA